MALVAAVTVFVPPECQLWRACRQARRADGGAWGKGIDVAAQCRWVEGWQPAPSFDEGGSAQATRTQRPQLRHRPAVSRDGHVQAGIHAIYHLASAIAQIPDRHGVHASDGITRDAGVSSGTANGRVVREDRA